MDLITSLANPLVKRARSLRRSKARAESGLFLVEGIRHVGEAIEAGWAIDSLLYAPEMLTSPFARELLERAAASGKHQPVSAQVMESLAEKDNPQGFLAVVRQQITNLEDLKAMTAGVALVAPQDPGNVGTILRTMDAVGAESLYLLDGGVDPFHPTVVRASMGALFWKRVVRATFDEMSVRARQAGIQLIGSSARGGVDPRSLATRAPWLLVLGSEQKGLSPEQQAACDVVVTLKMHGRGSSLNLAVAAALLQYGLSESSSAGA